jgi:hypothetical protein
MHAPWPIWKVMKIALYTLAHGIPEEYMIDLYNVGTSIIQKYIVVICEIFANCHKLFGIYIHILSTSWLCSIIEK